MSNENVLATETKSANTEENAEPLSKSRRKKNAKLAARARREAAGSQSSPESIEKSAATNFAPSMSTEILAVGSLVHSLGHAAASSAPSLSVAATSKKKKSKNKIKRQKSDPARLMSPLKNKCQHEERFAQAMENRAQILLEKSEKVRQQSKKVVEVRQTKAAARQQIGENLRVKMQQAEKKREQNLTTVKSKARDEAIKVHEINFINSIKSQHRILDVKEMVMEKEQKIVSRQQFLEEERAKKSEEQKARDAAVEDRRRQQEVERAAKISEMEEKKRQRVKKVEQNVNERLQQVRDRARDKALKITAIENAQQENLRSLREKIQKKAEISTRLHQERMALKRMRAMLLHSPRPGSADSASCVQDYVSSTRCRSHTGDDSPRKELDVQEKISEKIEMTHIYQKYDKMGRKLRQKLIKTQDGIYNSGAQGHRMDNSDVSHVFQILECLKFATGWASWNPHITSSMEPCLDRLARYLQSLVRSADRNLAEDLKNGILALLDLSLAAISSSMEGRNDTSVPEKPLCAIYNLLACLLDLGSLPVLLATSIPVRIVEHSRYFTELLVFQPNHGKIKVPEAVFDCCHKALERILSYFNAFCRQDVVELSNDRVSDSLRYFMTCGMIQMIGRYYTLQLHHQDGKLRYLRRSFQFTTWISRIVSARKHVLDQSSLLESEKEDLESSVHYELQIYRDILKSAPVFGSVTLLYDLLRLGRQRPRCLESSHSEIPDESYRVALDIVKMLNYVGNADLVPLQSAFRDLTLSIQFRHICSFLISHCSTYHEERAYLLHEVILLIGQFAFFSPEHQDIVHAGHPPNLLQQLTTLPVEYLVVPVLQDILLPTLIICCYQNRKNCSILAEEIDPNHLTLYVKMKEIDPWPKRDLERHFRLALSATTHAVKIFREHTDEDFLRYAFENRFPRSLWNAAALFFYVSSWEDDIESQCEKVEVDLPSDNYFFEEMCSLLPEVHSKSHPG